MKRFSKKILDLKNASFSIKEGLSFKMEEILNTFLTVSHLSSLFI